MPVDVKICGLKTAEAVDAAVEGGAFMTGFVFYPPSPRNLSPADAAPLVARVPAGVVKVGLFVDAADDAIDAVLDAAPLELLQFHGSESPDRVRAVKDRTGLPVMKVVPLASEDDLEAASDYEACADRLLFDAKPPKDMAGALPGGNALAFDWALLKGRTWALPWMLAGGLTADNLAEAVATSGATALDVSSGVEDAPGVKNVAKIRAFLAAAKRI
jgi:phosphoribosylanthranilate isomerase